MVSSLATVFAAGGIISQVTDWLDNISAQWWFLIVIAAIALLDAVIPAVPSETAVIIGGIAAGKGTQWLPAVIGVAAAGAFLGDNLAYLIGSKLEGPVARFAAKRPKWQERLDWAATQLHKRGGPLLVTARFIPGGRTAITLSSGMTEQPHHWFARWIALASILWASYAAGLGYFFGQRFKENHTLAFVLAFGVAIGATVLIEVVRHIRQRKRPDHDGTDAEPSSSSTTTSDQPA